MKTKLTFAFIIFNLSFIITMNATVRTVSNDAAGGAQYATLDAAYNAASDGDTLMLEGTNINYGISSAWSKRLTVIGIGTNPNKTFPRKTYFNGFSAYPTTGMNGSKFYGLNFTGFWNLADNLSNLTFDNCYFPDYVMMMYTGMNNIVFTNCIFASANQDIYVSGTNSNILFRSCVFNGYLHSNSSNTGTPALFDHCLFLEDSSPVLSVANYYQFNSCIFMNEGAIAQPTCTNNTFNNCIFRLASALPAGNSGANNIFLMDPQFVNYTIGGGYSPTYDFHLVATSPAMGTGASSTDMGIYGIATHFSTTGEVLVNPIVRNMFIQNVNIAPNGNLNVNVHATKPTDN